MELVVDANIVISALISLNGITCDLFFSNELVLFAPEFLLDEIKQHQEEIIDKSGLSNEEFNLALSLISSRIQFVPFSEFSKLLSKARAICPDEKDVEYFALSLKENCPFWSNDKVLLKQTTIKIISTSELIKQLF